MMYKVRLAAEWVAGERLSRGILLLTRVGGGVDYRRVTPLEGGSIAEHPPKGRAAEWRLKTSGLLGVSRPGLDTNRTGKNVRSRTRGSR